MRSQHTLFHSRYTILHSHQQCIRVPVSPHPCQHLLFSFFFFSDSSHSSGWYLIAVLHFPNYQWCWASFHVLISSCLYIFFEEISIRVLCLFFNWVIHSLLLSFRGSLYILDINSLWDVWFANIFSYSVGCLFTPLILCFVSKF